MGGGKGSSTTTVQMTPEQQRLLQAQTDFLTGTAFPAYSQTVGGAKTAYEQTAPAATQAARTATDVANISGAIQGAGGAMAYGQGLSGLQNLFSDQYKQEQIQAALQPAREETREQMTQQGALFGGAGGLGSARQALASRNLASLAEQRMGSVAAQTSADIEGRRQKAAESLLGAGQQGLTAAQQAAASTIGYAQTPQDIYSKYASVVFGIPQGNTTANFAGTQGQSTSGKSMGFKL